jgi:NAD-dependent DNA ligase
MSAAVAPTKPSQAPKSSEPAIKAAAAPKPRPAAAAPRVTKAFKTLCISGRLLSGLRKADYASALSVAGIQLVDEVVEGLDYLVLADPASISTKAQKARLLGVQILSEDGLIQLTSGGKP